MNDQQKIKLRNLINEYVYWSEMVAGEFKNMRKCRELRSIRAESHEALMEFVEGIACDHGEDKIYTYIDKPVYVCECGQLKDLDTRPIH